VYQDIIHDVPPIIARLLAAEEVTSLQYSDCYNHSLSQCSAPPCAVLHSVRKHECTYSRLTQATHFLLSFFSPILVSIHNYKSKLRVNSQSADPVSSTLQKQRQWNRALKNPNTTFKQNCLNVSLLIERCKSSLCHVHADTTLVSGHGHLYTVYRHSS